MTPVQHLRALLMLVLISGNLVVWCVPLLGVVLLRLALPRLNSWLDGVSASMYRAAVRFDDFFLDHLAQCRWEKSLASVEPNQVCIVIANHVSWADIFLLQNAVVHEGPILKFLSKRELMYVPVFAMILIAFRCPIVRRRARRLADEAARHADDLARVRQACEVLKESPSAMLIFPEGTRITREKVAAGDGSYQNVLQPKLGGFSVLMKSLAPLRPTVLDATLFFPETMSLWRFLGGAAFNMRIHIEAIPWRDDFELDPAAWLLSRWTEKDALIAAYRDK